MSVLIETYAIKHPGKKLIEDHYVVNQEAGVFGVFDGATPISSYTDEEGRNGAHLASRTFYHYFQQIPYTKSLKEEVKKANYLLLRKMLTHNIPIHLYEERWTTCVAMIHVTESIITYAGLGDSLVLAKFKDGTVKALTMDTVIGVSRRMRDKRERERAAGITLPDESYYKQGKNEAIYMRRSANGPFSYTVANGSKEVEGVIESGAVSRRDISQILLITDGFIPPHRKWEKVFSDINENGLKAYGESIERYEPTIPLDDRTAIFITF